MTRIIAALYEADCLANALTGGRRDMSISARVGYLLENGKACWKAKALAGFLNLFECDHCRAAYRRWRSEVA